MSRRDDWRTSDVDGAAAWERAHGIEALPHGFDVTAADVEPARPHHDPCGDPYCWGALLNERWAS